MMSKIKKCGLLFFTFLKIGLFTFGGGYAMISLMENEFVERKKWLPHNEFMDLLVIAESTPGPIAINSATYIGYKSAGMLGSAAATIGVCVPSFVIIYLISQFFDQFMQLQPVAAAFKGIQVCVVYLIFSGGMKMFKKMKKSPLTITMTSLTIVCLVAFSLFAVQFSTILYILIGAVVGLSAYGIRLLRKGKGETV